MKRGHHRHTSPKTPPSSALCILQSAFLLFPPLVHSQELGQCIDIIPLRPSATWIYEGTALWTRAGATVPDSAPVTWTMSVEQTRDLSGSRLALVRGLVTQLAWYEPGRTPGLGLLVCRGSRLYALETESDSIARTAFERWNDDWLSRAKVWLELPLRDGALFGQNPPRNDGLYGWHVEQLHSSRALPGSCPAGVGARFTVGYRSLPDHRIVEWQPGIGIAALTYGHHGTPAGADVVLAGCRQVSP